jgi:hypothetical protein
VLGASEASIEAVHGPEEKDFLVWPENWPAMQAFFTVQTQWSRGGMGDLAGLDYTRVRDGLGMAGIDVTPEIFQKLRIFESAVLEALAKKEKGSTEQ